MNLYWQGIKMKFTQKLLAILATVGCLGVMAPAMAASTAVDGRDSATVAKENFKKDALCTKCHDESESAPVLSIYQTKHGVRGDSRTPTCQSCHGESQGHLAKKDSPPDVVFKKGAFSTSDENVRTDSCITCHSGAKRLNWPGSVHPNNDVACNDCHKVHQPKDNVLDKFKQTAVCYTCHKEQRADSYKTSTHPIAVGKVVCSDCHNPHGSTGPKLLVKNTLNETCFLCHAEKRGPMRFEHQPVVEDCSYCHTPHGSNITPLLKDRPPLLCADCHDGPHQSRNPFGNNMGGRQVNPTITAPSSGATGRSCMNCHSLIHGSNSPAGGYFQR